MGLEELKIEEPIFVKKDSVTKDFDSKISTIWSYIESNKVHFVHGSNKLTVAWDTALTDSLLQFPKFNNRMELKVQFTGENMDVSADAGGMTKEWYSLICLELLKPEWSKEINIRFV